MSVWSTVKKMKLKTFSTWMAKKLVSVGDKVIKLREERKFLCRVLVIQQSPPELVPRLHATICNYKMSVPPRSTFVSGGPLLMQHTKHPSYMLWRRQIAFGLRHIHQPRQSCRHHVRKHQSRHQHKMIHTMASPQHPPVMNQVNLMTMLSSMTVCL